ncbi:MAG: hypothetical protein HQK58_12670 [Deltaproteobacteria bacterium]|nr:hypothetical protein [Deltaproteobacteria bacterium]
MPRYLNMPFMLKPAHDNTGGGLSPDHPHVSPNHIAKYTRLNYFLSPP